MNKSMKRILVFALVSVMSFSSLALLTSCKEKESSDATDVSDATSSDSTEDATTTTVAFDPTPLDSVCPGQITINGIEISAAEYDFYYYSMLANYQAYAAYGYYATDADGNFDLTAACTETGYEDLTWAEYLDVIIKQQIQDNVILACMAEDEGYTLTDDDQTQVDSFTSSVAEYAETCGYDSDTVLKAEYGSESSIDALTPVLERYLLALDYATAIQATYTFTDEELTLPTVYHILFYATSDSTEDELATAKSEAEAALAQVTTYDDMVSVGDAAVADGTAQEAQEYSGIQPGEMVDAFNDWCFDASRQPGDTAVIQTEYGYHVMYFVENAVSDDYKEVLSQNKLLAYLTELEQLPEYQVVMS